FDRGAMLEYVTDMAGLKKEDVARVDIKGVFSFIEMPEPAMAKAMEAFNGEIYNGRKVRVEISGDGHVSSMRKTGSGGRSNFRDRDKSSGDRSEGKKEKRGWSERPPREG